MVFNAAEEGSKPFTWIRKTSRKHTEQACRAFKEEICSTNWAAVLPQWAEPDYLVREFESIIKEKTDRLFPLVSTSVRSNESPWITNGIRRLAASKR